MAVGDYSCLKITRLNVPTFDIIKHCTSATTRVCLVEHWAQFFTLTLWWARWRLKSPVSRLFVQPFVQAHIKETIKALRHWPWTPYIASRVERPPTLTDSIRVIRSRDLWIFRHIWLQMVLSFSFNKLLLLNHYGLGFFQMMYYNNSIMVTRLSWLPLNCNL